MKTLHVNVFNGYRFLNQIYVLKTHLFILRFWLYVFDANQPFWLYRPCTVFCVYSATVNYIFLQNTLHLDFTLFSVVFVLWSEAESRNTLHNTIILAWARFRATYVQNFEFRILLVDRFTLNYGRENLERAIISVNWGRNTVCKIPKNNLRLKRFWYNFTSKIAPEFVRCARSSRRADVDDVVSTFLFSGKNDWYFQTMATKYLLTFWQDKNKGFLSFILIIRDIRWFSINGSFRLCGKFRHEMAVMAR